MKKQYIIFEGTCFNPEGWDDEELSQFMEKLCDVAESFGADVQLSAAGQAFTEEELEEEEDDEPENMQ